MHINEAINMAIKALNEGRPHFLVRKANIEIDEAIETLVNLKTVEVELCHCSRPVVKEFHKDGNWCGDGPDVKDCSEEHFSRGMCKHCDMVRCDAFPGACKTFFASETPERKGGQ